MTLHPTGPMPAADRRRPEWLGLLPADAARTVALADGETLFRQGDAAAAIYAVDQGCIRLIRHLEDGSTVTLHVARAGEGFAEAALFSPIYHCDAVAQAATRLLAVPKSRLLAELERNPGAALSFARMMAVQVRQLRSLLELRSVRSAPARVLGWLRLMAQGDPPTVRLDRNWTQIASELGLTREAVYRALAGLERDRRIRRESGRVRLTDSSDL